MNKRLLLGAAALLLSGANAAFASRGPTAEAFACRNFTCEDDNECTPIECGKCTQGGGETSYCNDPKQAE